MILLFRHIRFLYVFAFITLGYNAFASHYRAGEITYTWISGKTYMIKALTYTDPMSSADQSTGKVTMSYGDGTSAEVYRDSTTLLDPSYMRRSVYISYHTYQTDGGYTISLADPNRVNGIKNINFGFSSDYAFYVETYLFIDGSIGVNQSPVLLIPPIDKGCAGFLYIHNPGAHDPDGDSLSYTLIPPKMATNSEVPWYQTPSNISINSQTGDLIWNTPPIATNNGGDIYNVAIRINEWRRIPVPYVPLGYKDVNVGYVVRDMQIVINNCINRPPKIDTLKSVCIQANGIVQFNVSAADPDQSQRLVLQGFGAPFDPTISTYPATLSNTFPSNPVAAQFTWRTSCNNIRYSPFNAFIKATDNYSYPLSDLKFSSIKVIGPAPLNVKLQQNGNGFNITWNKDACGLASYFKIYKRIDSSHWNPDVCYTGVPQNLFILIDSVKILGNINDTTYYDDNKGEGLTPFINYCYRIVAVYPARMANGTIIVSRNSESYASIEVCGTIIRTKPIITHVSVRNTDASNGSILLRWLKPSTLDTTYYTSPYNLVFKRSLTNKGPFVAFDSMTYSSFSSLNDSMIIDTNINTTNNQYYYKIEFNSITNPGNHKYIDVSPTASSVKAIVYSTDRTNILSWTYKVPWFNTKFVIYRKNKLTGFTVIDTTSSTIYRDTGLINHVNYCYIIKTLGNYSLSLYNNTLENYSQEICGTPVDTVRPCAPILTLTPPCNSFNDFQNVLNWVPKTACSGDVVRYKIYFKRLSTDLFDSIDGVDKSTLSYYDSRLMLKQSVAGCYAVTGVDSNFNESYITNEVCTDNCPEYRIPNVFTPNGDSHNDTLYPFAYRFVDRIVMNIYNRWGDQVFQTNDLDIKWDGKDQTSKSELADGVYFYICDVYEVFLAGVKKRTIKGTIQIMR
ncbi:MAG: gliding motility-associated C-terminal domain-containing protein [Bacteroidota bacterium]